MKCMAYNFVPQKISDNYFEANVQVEWLGRCYYIGIKMSDRLKKHM